MPCYDPDTHEYPKRLAAKVNRLTCLLCDMGCELTSRDMLGEFPEFAAWYERHEKIDALLEKSEAIWGKFKFSKGWGPKHPQYSEYKALQSQLDTLRALEAFSSADKQRPDVRE